METDSILLRARVPAARYKKAEKVLNRLGLKPGDAVNMLLAQIEMRQGLPFELGVSDRQVISSRQQMDEWDQTFGPY